MFRHAAKVNHASIALLAALLIAHPSQAAMLGTSVVNDVVDLGGPSPSRLERSESAPTGPLSDSLSTTVGDATGASSVTVDYGYATVAAVADVSAAGTPFFTRIANGSSRANWVDDITIDAPGLNGQLFTITFLMEFSGSLFSSVIQPPGGATATSRWNAALTLGDAGTSLFSVRGEQRESFLSQFVLDSDFGVIESQAVSARFGTPFRLSFVLNGSTGALSGFGGSAADANVDIYARWLGFGDVLDAAGKPLSGLSVVSASGFDYAQAYAVPLPSGIGLLGFAVLSLTRLRRGHPGAFDVA